MKTNDDETMTKIMVGYDGSQVSKTALDLAIEYTRAFNGKIFVVTSMNKGTDAETEDIRDLEQELEQVRGMLANKSIPCETHLLIRAMTPGEDLVAYAKEKRIDKIILGIQKMSKVGKLVFGSTAQYVILHAACPVTTLK